MSGHGAESDAPLVQGLVLFEVYEASGSLLVVTSDGAVARGSMEPGDVMVRRPWATAATPEPMRVTPPGEQVTR